MPNFNEGEEVPYADRERALSKHAFQGTTIEGANASRVVGKMAVWLRAIF